MLEVIRKIIILKKKKRAIYVVCLFFSLSSDILFVENHLESVNEIPQRGYAMEKKTRVTYNNVIVQTSSVLRQNSERRVRKFRESGREGLHFGDKPFKEVGLLHSEKRRRTQCSYL